MLRRITAFFVLVTPLSAATTPRDDINARLNTGILAEYLPAAASGMPRGPVETVPADAALFGSGTSTRARYAFAAGECVVTITGDSPNMQGVAMTFSNPAIAGFTGNRMTRVGSERVLVQADGEWQVFANNFLVQVRGDCTDEQKSRLVAATNVDGLRRLLVAVEPTAATRPNEGSSSRLLWARTFGGRAGDWSYAMTGTRDGGLAAAGRTESKGAGREDAWVVRLDGSGEKLWDRAYGGAAADRARAIIETRDGGLLVAGATESKGAGEFDAWILKLDARGELLWDRHYGGPGADWASAVVETRDGRYAIAAYTQDTLATAFDAWVLMLDARGELLWERRFGGAAEEWASAITETRDGLLAVAGHTESKGAGSADAWVLVLDAAGSLLWERTFGGSERDYASAIAATADGGVVVAGPTSSQGAGLVDAWLLRLDRQGDLRWDRTFGGKADDWPRAVLERADGGYALSGYTMSQGAGQYDMWLLAVDATGRLTREEVFGGPANEWARSLVAMPDGGLAIAGDTWSQGEGLSDVWVLRIAPPADR
ncbi:MAG: hypothetical protein FJ197_11805 [Gammaproteobacteria bacterium]|nr:hypothetical protein [Gammaproteobacteria bacterium]